MNPILLAHSPDELLESVVRITELRDRDHLGTSLVQTLQELTGAGKVLLYRHLTDHAGHALLQPAALATPDEVAGSATLAGAACLSLEEHDAYRHCVTQDTALSAGKTARLYPVHAGNDAICGVLRIESAALSEPDEHLIAGFLRIYRNFMAILDDSERDTLTGLLNRKTFDRNIARILAHLEPAAPDIGPSPDRRHGADNAARYWLAVMDVDHFKRVNDQFGHLYGDEVLLLLARLMMDTFRQHDHLFRFGGEEFVLLLDPTDRDNAEKVLERFRIKVEAYPFPQVGQVTVSIGFAGISAQDSPSVVVGQADQALYYAKHHGRNRVCSYEALVAQGEIEAQHFKSEADFF